MRKIQTFFRLLKNPIDIIPALIRNGFFKWIPDRYILRIAYYCYTGEKLETTNPTTFNEKIQWLKLNDRNPEYTQYADKYAVRDYVANKIGSKYLIPIIGIYDSVDSIPWGDLPDQFVLKCSHGTGCNIICSNKAQLDIIDSKRKLRKWMRTNYYWRDREWPYKLIKPRIVCEKFLVDESQSQLKDYKVFCFDGRAHAIQVHFDRFSDHKRNLYTRDWHKIEASIGKPNDSQYVVEKPVQLEKMISLTETISEGIPHVRIDFYSIFDELYFGEMTFFHSGGYLKFDPPELGVAWGDLIKVVSILIAIIIGQ